MLFSRALESIRLTQASDPLQAGKGLGVNTHGPWLTHHTLDRLSRLYSHGIGAACGMFGAVLES